MRVREHYKLNRAVGKGHGRTELCEHHVPGPAVHHHIVALRRADIYAVPLAHVEKIYFREVPRARLPISKAGSESAEGQQAGQVPKFVKFEFHSFISTYSK